jgi:hypothetical protein
MRVPHSRYPVTTQGGSFLASTTPGSGVTMVGISALDEAPTIGAVTRAAAAGLAEQSRRPGDGMIVLADNGSTDGTPEAFLGEPVDAPRHVINSPRANSGKGTNVLALIDMAVARRADRLVLLDADVRSAEPSWVTALAGEVALGSPALATPIYRRNRHEANITNHLAGPLVAALFGWYVQQPIGGEFALNAALLRRVRSWPLPGSARYYGIDIWLTANALREGHRVGGAYLGRKVHDPAFRNILHMPHQVLDSLLCVAGRLGTPRRPEPGTLTDMLGVDDAPARYDLSSAELVAAVSVRYLTEHRDDMLDLLPRIRNLPAAPWGVRITTEVWPSLLADAVVAVSTTDRARVRDHLVALYLSRVFSYRDEIAPLDPAGITKLLTWQVEHTIREVAARSVTFGGGSGPGSTQDYDRGRWAQFPVS